jgi:MoxR-like ATPase
VFRRGRETRALPLIMSVGASNQLPEDDSLGALFDRFLLRVRCDNVPQDRLGEVLDAGWKLEQDRTRPAKSVSIEEVRDLGRILTQVDLAAARPHILAIVRRLRLAGLAVSDRRAVKMQRLVAASALLCGRLEANVSDLWVFRYIWDTEEQVEILAAIVEETLSKSDARDAHPRAKASSPPDPEALAGDLDALEAAVSARRDEAHAAELRDHLGILAARCQWVNGEEQRSFLQRRVEALWQRLSSAS